MRLEVNRLEGLSNDLVLRLERGEIDRVLLSLPHRDALMALPGIPRHREATPDEAAGLAACRVPIETHLQRLGVIDRAVTLSNRNLGTNHGHLAWQRGAAPPIFHVREDPCDYPAYSCLAASRDGALSIEDLRFDVGRQRIRDARDERDVSDEIEWAVFGQRVLRQGRLTRIEDIASQFYDIRHVLAFDTRREEGEAVRRGVYAGYPRGYREQVERAWRQGVPRARYYHNAIGLSADAIHVVQREGTVEEVGAALREAGADAGIILDNGGSVACWAWWVNDYAGGLVSPTVDYRPEGTSAIAFVLEGRARVDLPGGSVSYSVL
ncbi:MAG TPA: hypothetical protein VF921_20320 [Vicinamibacterales bacterium]